MIRTLLYKFHKTEICFLKSMCTFSNLKRRHFRCYPWPVASPTIFIPMTIDRGEYSVQTGASIVKGWKKCYVRFLTETKTNKNKHVDLLGKFSEDKFRNVFKLATEELRGGESFKEIKDAVIHLDQMISYNVFGGKMNRAMMVLTSFNLLASHEQLTEENQKKAILLGWCVELLQSCFLVADDIMDQSITRRGKPCWYKLDTVGLSGFNDAFLLYSCYHSILRSNFKEEPCYIHIIELFDKVLQQTLIGQSLDLLTSPTGNTDLSRFTQERYDAIVKWKTGFYSFYMPVALALYLVGINDEATHNQAKEILLRMGNFFQVQDDYLDCYGDAETIGKVGTDIEENKCSWLIVQALKIANQEQKQVLETNYGYDDPSKVANVKHIYNQLGIELVYKEYERTSYLEIQKQINNMQGDLPKELFLEYAAKLYQRMK